MRQVAGQHVEQRGLAGAVGADDRAYLASLDGEVHAGYGLNASETLAEANGLED